MNKHLKLEVYPNLNEASIALCDTKGNGILVLRGKLGGCDCLSEDSQKLRLEALSKLQVMINSYDDPADIPDIPEATPCPQPTDETVWLLVHSASQLLEEAERIHGQPLFYNAHGRASDIHRVVQLAEAHLFKALAAR